MNEQRKLWAKHAAEQLANVQNEHGIPTPRTWHMAAGYTPSPEMIEFAALIKEQMKAMPDIRLNLSESNTVTGRLSQAAQFDGETNGKIESVALMAWNHGLNYMNYLKYAHEAQTTALSLPEYKAICNSWNDMDALVKECAHRIQVHGISEDYDNILLQHWDSNILKPDLDDMYQGMAQADEMCRNMHQFGTIDAPKEDSNILFNQRNHTE